MLIYLELELFLVVLLYVSYTMRSEETKIRDSIIAKK
jgi:hypothetical protein